MPACTIPLKDTPKSMAYNALGVPGPGLYKQEGKLSKGTGLVGPVSEAGPDSTEPLRDLSPNRRTASNTHIASGKPWGVCGGGGQLAPSKLLSNGCSPPDQQLHHASLGLAILILFPGR